MRRARLRAIRRRDDEQTADLGRVSPDQPISNRMLLSLVGSSRGSGAEIGEELAPSPPRPVADTVPEVTGAEELELTMEDELAGHGNGPGSVTTTAPSAAADTAAGSGAVDVDLIFKANEPREEYKPASEIASGHDQEDAVGWTTPAYNIQARAGANASRATIDVTLDFTIELAEEYEGKTLDVLREHEQGHVNLGTVAGEAMLSHWLEARLEALPAITRSSFTGIVRSAAQAFEFWEGTFSWLYDRIDYPRMREAYLGARMTLDELVALSPEVGRMSEALREFASADEDEISAASAEVLAARSALSELDVARIQYNREFEELVWEADDQIAVTLQSLEDASPVQSRLRRVISVLSDFTWRAPAAG